MVHLHLVKSPIKLVGFSDQDNFSWKNTNLEQISL